MESEEDKYIENENESNINSQEDVLLEACKDGSLFLVKGFVNEGVDVRIKEKDWPNSTCLHLAAIYGHFEVFKYLSNCKGIEIDVCDSDKWTPLICASDRGHLEYVIFELIIVFISIVKFIIESNKVDVNAQSLSKETALHRSVVSEHGEIVKYLLDYGANVDIKNDENKIPKDLIGDNIEIKLLFDEFYKKYNDNIESAKKTEDLKEDISNEKRNDNDSNNNKKKKVSAKAQLVKDYKVKFIEMLKKKLLSSERMMDLKKSIISEKNSLKRKDKIIRTQEREIKELIVEYQKMKNRNSTRITEFIEQIKEDEIIMNNQLVELTEKNQYVEELQNKLGEMQQLLHILNERDGELKKYKSQFTKVKNEKDKISKKYELSDKNYQRVNVMLLKIQRDLKTKDDRILTLNKRNSVMSKQVSRLNVEKNKKIKEIKDILKKSKSTPDIKKIKIKAVSLDKREKNYEKFKKASLKKKEDTLKERELEIDRKENSLKDREGELNERNRVLNEKETKIEEKIKSIEDGKNSVIMEKELEINKKLKEIEDEEAEMKEKKNEMNDKLKEIEEERTEMKGKEKEMNNKLKEIEKEKTELNEKNEELNTKLKEIDVEGVEIKKQEQEISKKLKEIDDGKKEMMGKENEVNNKFKEIEDGKKKIEEEISKKLKEIEDGKKEMKEKEQEVNNKLKEIEDGKKKIEKEMNKKFKEIEDGKKEMKEKELELIEKTEKFEILKGEIEKEKAVKSETNNIIKVNIRSDLTQIKEQLEGKEKENDLLIKREAELKVELDKRKSLIEEIEKKLELQSQRLLEYENEVQKTAELQKEYEHEKCELDKKSKENSSLIEKGNELELELDQKKSLLKDYEEKLELKNQEILKFTNVIKSNIELQKENEIMKSELNIKKQENDSLTLNEKELRIELDEKKYLFKELEIAYGKQSQKIFEYEKLLKLQQQQHKTIDLNDINPPEEENEIKEGDNKEEVKKLNDKVDKLKFMSTSLINILCTVYQVD